MLTLDLHTMKLSFLMTRVLLLNLYIPYSVFHFYFLKVNFKLKDHLKICYIKFKWNEVKFVSDLNPIANYLQPSF
jgi:hypothetical protein